MKKGISGSSITAYGEGLQRVKLGYPARFDINPHIADHGSINVIVKGWLKILMCYESHYEFRIYKYYLN